MRLRRFLTLDAAVPAVLAIAICAFASASTSVLQISDGAKIARWVLLFLLLVLAAAWSLALRSPWRLPLSVATTAALFCGLAFVSTSWSGDARLTFARAGSLAVLFATAALLADGATGRADGPLRLMLAILFAATAIAIAGLLVLAFDHSAAVEPASPDLPARYRGFGENPNTVPLLLALCFPIVAWLLVRVRSWTARTAVAAAGLLLLGSVIASASRGSLLAGFFGVLLVVAASPGRPWRRLALATGVCVLLALSLVIALAPRSKGYPASLPERPPASTPGPKPRYVDVEGAFPLDFDIGTLLAGSGGGKPRTLFGLSGRGIAWRGAIDQGNARPALGYGFGTESQVFEDRYANFVSGLPENSYIGLYLQLGAIGVVAFLALSGALLVATWRARRRTGAAALFGAFGVSLALGIVQSYLYSVGNVATLALWTCAFVGAAAATREEIS